jgi:dTDP-4-amino-4,6-dideoxygalactose transaminase
MTATAVRVPFVDLPLQHQRLAAELQAAIARVFDRSGFILGAEVEEFERRFAEYLRADAAVGVGSGLDALRLALAGLGVGPGDEVIVPANTYIATALAVSACGAQPVFVDVTEHDFGLDPDCLLRAITPRTRAVIPVHLYGQPCSMDAVLDIAAGRNLFVIEDACQAHGAVWRGRRCGTLGDAGCFSFYPSKNLGAAGDGGMVVTNRPELAQRIRRLRDYGQEAKYRHVVKGTSSRLDGLQAAILGVKLPHLEAWNAQRAAHAATYTTLLSGLDGIAVPSSLPSPDHVYHLYVIRARHRDALAQHLAAAGVQAGIHYPVPIHRQPAYADTAAAGDYPVAERLAGEILSLPMYPELASDQLHSVAAAIQAFVHHAGGRAGA